MDFSEISNPRQPSKAAQPRFGLRVGTLLAIVGLMALGFWGFHEYFSPTRVWERAIHDPARLRNAWTEVERERTIEGLDPASTVQRVFEAMDDPDPAIRGYAIWCVPSLAGDPDEVSKGQAGDPKAIIERLAQALADPDVDVRTKAAEALGQVYKNGKKGATDGLKPRTGHEGRDEALKALTLALKDADAKVRKAAVGSVGQVVYESGPSSDPLRSGQKDDPALKVVEARLQDPDIAVQVEAAFVLGCNDRGGEAVPMLVTFLKDQPLDKPFSYVANRAFMALTILAARSEAAVSFLADQMPIERESYPDRPRDALAWAARQGTEPHTWVRKRAREALKSNDPEIRFQAAFLMFDIGLGIEALDQLIEALHDDSVDTRIRAVQAIAEIGEADVRAMEALQAATNDPDFEVRARALGALEAIELEKMK